MIIGVHAPEFAFERVPDNVRTAVRKLGIEYPVALDNDFDTWTAYANQYWPAKYLIDRRGRVRFFHFGEGEYDETETEIRRFLGQRAGPKTSVPDPTPTGLVTPESYLGYERLDRTAARIAVNQESDYRFPERLLAPDELAFAGRIRFEPERIVTGPAARLRLQFRAREVHLVLGGRGTIDVLLDGRLRHTVDIGGEPRLYTLLSLDRLREGLLELRFTSEVSAYAFTFG